MVRLWRGEESVEDAMLRFTLELEFVQCLSNPFYLKCASLGRPPHLLPAALVVCLCTACEYVEADVCVCMCVSVCVRVDVAGISGGAAGGGAAGGVDITNCTVTLALCRPSAKQAA